MSTLSIISVCIIIIAMVVACCFFTLIVNKDMTSSKPNGDAICGTLGIVGVTIILSLIAGDVIFCEGKKQGIIDTLNNEIDVDTIYDKNHRVIEVKDIQK